MQLNWRVKSAIFGIADVVGPGPLYWAQKNLTKRSRIAFADIRDSWTFHERNIEASGCRRIIEFGAGKSLAQNLYLSRLGIEQVLVDINPMVDIDLVNAAVTQFNILLDRDGPEVSSLADLKAKYRISYVAPLDMRETGFEDGSFDACISTDTLEHIPGDVIEAIWPEVMRLLRPGGIVSASIDYSDHYAHTDRNISALNYLRFTEKEWRRHNHNCHYQNRLRHRQHVDMMKRAGLQVASENASCAAPNDAAFLQENLTGDPTDYCTEGRILARKEPVSRRGDRYVQVLENPC